VKNPHSLSGVGVVLQFLCCEITCKQQKHAESTESESVHQGVLKVFFSVYTHCIYSSVGLG